MSYRGFPSSLLSLVACQKCSGTLSAGSNAPFIFDGEIFCTVCGELARVRKGIVCFVQDEELDEVRRSEIRSRDEDAPRYDRRLAARYEKEVISTLRGIGDVAGKNVIEYGAGTGRITKGYVSRAKAVIASDFSFRSLEILAENLPDGAHIGLVCADATAFRVRPGSFDVAIATQFYEHLPTNELRERFLSGCFAALRSGGRFISTTYHYDLRMRLGKRPQEGMHPTGIFYHYYTKEELTRDISRHFLVEKVVPIDITLPGEVRLRVPAKVGGAISRLCEFIPIARDLGHLLLVAARKIP